MKIIISPAKKMNVDTDGMAYETLPHFLNQTQKIHKVLKHMNLSDLKSIWKCNDQIAFQNYERIQNMSLKSQLTPALFAYEGIQYQYISPHIFNEGEFKYLSQHLRILSGFYGILRPFDGVTPYRLEMQAKLPVQNSKDLYDFWGDKIYKTLHKETDTMVNLASKEYSKIITHHAKASMRIIDIEFSEIVNGKRIEKGTLCKMARGEMVRYMTEMNIQEPEKIKAFNRMNYTFSTLDSTENKYVFLRKI